MLPNLVAPILVYATLLIPTNILFEAALSFLGVGVQAADRDLGRHARRTRSNYYTIPHFMLWPGHGDLQHRPGLQPVRRRAA